MQGCKAVEKRETPAVLKIAYLGRPVGSLQARHGDLLFSHRRSLLYLLLLLLLLCLNSTAVHHCCCNTIDNWNIFLLLHYYYYYIRKSSSLSSCIIIPIVSRLGHTSLCRGRRGLPRGARIIPHKRTQTTTRNGTKAPRSSATNHERYQREHQR